VSLTTEKCFDIAISLVTQHDKENLLLTFEEILRTQFTDCYVETHNVQNEVILSKEPAINDLISQCIETRKAFFIAKENTFLYPVVSLGKVKHIVLLKGKSVSEHLNLIEQLTKLFSNQQLLLDNNNHDPLTSLLNRHSFETRLSSVIDMRQRRGKESNVAYCFAILDIDFFKRVNDDFGHLYGDEVLILFANIMENTFRHEDMLFRYGGEEFAVLLKDIELDTATIVLDRFRQNIENYEFPQVGKITVSIGVTELEANSSRIEVIRRADQALYYSKEHGRNQVNSFETLVSTGELVDSHPDADDIELF